MLTVKNLSVAVGTKKIINDFSHTFKKGNVYVIMGPNGSGKSTLAHALMGDPRYALDRKSRIILKKEVITRCAPEERAARGMYLSFQSPLALTGVSVLQLLRAAVGKKKDALAVRTTVALYAKKLRIPADLLSRSLNEGFSGGERKKMEMLQAAVLDPSVLILDEIDTGVDVDALKTIARFLAAFHTKDKTIILITHYTRILKYLAPDRVLVMKNGALVAEGPKTFARDIEKSGYDKL